MDSTKGGGVFPVNGGAESKNVYTEGYNENCPTDDCILSCGGFVDPLHIIMVGKRGLNIYLVGRICPQMGAIRHLFAVPAKKLFIQAILRH